MPKSSADIYARCLLSHRGYPLWTPEPSHELLAFRRDGLRIGDVGVVVPEDGSFDVFFNICLPQDHPFHQATGVPDNFKPIQLSDMDIRIVVNAEKAGSIIANSSVKMLRTIERSEATLSHITPSGLDYEFNLPSSEGALLILPEGAERHDLRNHHRFLEAATQHGADWYRFAEEKVGRIISNDSLYLITGLHKSRSWSLAAFEKTSDRREYPAQFKVRGDDIAVAGTWHTMRALNWRVGPIVNSGISNQTVLIRGFKVMLRTGMFGTRRISVKADAPSTRQNRIQSSGAVPGNTWLPYIFGGLSTGRVAESFSNKIGLTVHRPEVDPERSAITAVNTIPSTEQGDITAFHACQDSGPVDNLKRIVSRSEFPPDLSKYITRDGEFPVASGGCADIYRGTFHVSQTAIKVAIKVIKVYSEENPSREINRLLREMRVWMKLEHTNVLALFGITTGFGPSPAMVCPWLDNGTLRSYLMRRTGELGIQQALALIHDVASGLQYLHSHSIVHGDLSGSNVLIDANGRACITDFGLSIVLDEFGSTLGTSSAGIWRATLRWAAPELLDLTNDDTNTHTRPTKQSDIYAFGGIMLQILTGKVPYHYYSRDVQIVAALFRGETPVRPDDPSVTDRRWMFIQRCWSPFREIMRRPTGEEIVAFARDELFYDHQSAPYSNSAHTNG